MSKVRIPKTAAPFRRWLEQQNPDKRFYGCDSESCPLAHYLHDKGAAGAIVVCFYYQTSATSQRIDTPEWAQWFISEIDDRALRTKDHRVRARTALRILNEVTR